jgi:MFS family permease
VVESECSRLNTLRKDLRAIAAEGAASSIMVGIGENYLPAFVLALTASQIACGLAATVPLVAGAAMQLLAPYVLARGVSYRRWVATCAAIQAVVFLPLMGIAWNGSAPVLLVFALAALYWATGMAGGPAWSTWIGTLVPERIRAKFLARRTRFAQLGILVGLVGGGMALQAGKGIGEPVRVFALLFFVAALTRMISAWLLASQSEPACGCAVGRSWPDETRAADPSSTCPGRLLVYMVFVQVAVYLSGPYFTPYMLCQLELSYGGWAALTCVAYVAKVVFLPAFGLAATRWGVRRLLWIGGVTITPVSALWLLSDSFAYLVTVQVFSGIAWAAYELAMLLVFVDTIPAKHRIRVLTIYNLANAVAIFVGSMTGGAILALLGETHQAYMTLFALSGVGRLVSLGALARASHPVEAMPSSAHRSTSPGVPLAEVPPATAPKVRPHRLKSLPQAARQAEGLSGLRIAQTSRGRSYSSVADLNP